MYDSCDNASPSFLFCVKEVQEHEMVETGGGVAVQCFTRVFVPSPLGSTVPVLHISASTC